MLLPEVFKGYQNLQDKRDACIAALMKVCKTDEEVFTTKRLYGLGGSDMAKVMGESKWGSAYEIWQVKTFRQNKTIKNDIPLEVGHELEEMIARRYEKQTGFTVREANSVAMVGMPFLVGNFDRVVFDKAPEEGGKIIGGLECKTTGINNSVVVNGVMRSKWGKANIYDGTTLVQESNLIDPEYMAQVQFYMLVSGLKWWDVGVLISNTEIRFYRVHFDQAYCNRMYEVACNFWINNVLEDKAPAITFSDAQNMQPEKDVEMQANADLIARVQKIKEYDIEIKALEEKQALLKNALATEIVDVTKVKYTDAQGKSKTLLTFKGSTRTSFDSKAFQVKHPDLYQEFMKTTQTARTLRIY